MIRLRERLGIEHVGDNVSQTDAIVFSGVVRQKFSDANSWNGIVDTSKMSSVFRAVSSLNGTQFDVLKSAMQKFVRRSNVEQAQRCTAEIDIFSHIEGGETLRTNMIHRLMIIYLEDVGLANVGMWKSVDKQIDQLLCLRKTGDRAYNRELERDILMQLVTDLASSQHSRTLSHVNHVFNRDVIERWYPQLKWTLTDDDVDDIPRKIRKSVEHTESAYVLHYLQKRDIRAMKWARKIAEFSGKCGKQTWIAHLFSLLRLAVVNHPREKVYNKLIRVAQKWHRELSNLKEKTLTWSIVVMCLVNNVYVSWQSKPTVESTVKHQESIVDLCTVDQIYCRTLSNVGLTVPSYAIDVHTKEGRQNGSDAIKFALEGSIVTNVNQQPHLYHSVYIDSKIHSNVVHRSRMSEDNYTFVCRAQLTTSAHKTDTYIVLSPKTAADTYVSVFCPSLDHRTHGGDHSLCYLMPSPGIQEKYKFVKGPYLSDDIDIYNASPAIAVLLSEIKRAINLPFVQSEMVYMYPSSKIQCPLGIRTRVEKDKLYPFLVTEMIHNEKNTLGRIPTKERSSKLWPKTQVVDWESITLFRHIDPSVEDDKVIAQWKICLTFRYVMGVPDNAPRNFVVCESTESDAKVYGIDEDTFGKDARLDTMSRKAKDRLREIEFDYSLLSKWKEVLVCMLPPHILSGALERLERVEDMWTEL